MRILRLIVLMSSVGLIAGCGYKADLYLPDAPQPEKQLKKDKR